MEKKKKYKKVIVWLILAVSVCVMAVSGYQLWGIEQTYQVGNQNYQELADKVCSFGSSGSGTKLAIPDLKINFTTLKNVNKDTAAWLYCPDTVINYPIMKATDYSYYLHHLPDGTYNVNGTLFIDYNNRPDFTDKLTVIYGHHMKSGRMFGSLAGYKHQSYFNEHPYVYLYTESGNYRIDFKYGCVIGAGEWRNKAFMYEKNLNSLLTYAAQNTTFSSAVQYSQGDRVIALSTCSYEFDDARYVVIGVLRNE